MNIYDVQKKSNIYGPGIRFVIWVQGCSIKCKGCWNKDTWSTSPNQLYSIDDLFEQIKSTPNIDGVTFLGGEPMDQGEELLSLIQKIKETGLNIMTYTGYNKDQFNHTMMDIYILSDIIVIGPYIDSLRSDYLKWRGSKNQIIEYHTNVLIDKTLENENFTEIYLVNDGTMKLSGYPLDDLKKMINDLKE